MTSHSVTKMLTWSVMSFNFGNLATRMQSLWTNESVSSHTGRQRVNPGCTSIKGFQNPKQNGWMNTVLQVICGSSFFNLLDDPNTEWNDVKALLCQDDGKKFLPLTRFRKIGTLVDMDLADGNQKDAAEFFVAIMDSLEPRNRCCKSKTFNFLKCVNCSEMTGDRT